MITDNYISITDNGDLFVESDCDGHERDACGRFVNAKLPYPYIYNLELLSSALKQQLEDASALARNKKRLSNEVMDEMIINICSGHYVHISVIAKLMDRTPQNLQEKQLVPLIKQGKIRLAFPHVRRHKRQGYIANVEPPCTQE